MREKRNCGGWFSRLAFGHVRSRRFSSDVARDCGGDTGGPEKAEKVHLGIVATGRWSFRSRELAAGGVDRSLAVADVLLVGWLCLFVSLAGFVRGLRRAGSDRGGKAETGD